MTLRSKPRPLNWPIMATSPSRSSEKPVTNEWQTGEPYTPHPHATNVGLVCGELIGADIDLWNPEHVKQIRAKLVERLGEPGFERLGQKGAMLGYRNTGAGFSKIKITGVDLEAPDGRHKPRALIEVLSSGRMFVALGTHPDTKKEYRYVGEATPLNTPLTSLPPTNEATLRTLVAELVPMLTELGYQNVHVEGERSGDREVKPASASSGVPVSWENLRVRLSYIHPAFDGARPACYPTPSLKRQAEPLSYGGQVWLGIALCLRDADIPLLDQEPHDWCGLIEDWSTGELWKRGRVKR
jgi:hypothetical protein